MSLFDEDGWYVGELEITPINIPFLIYEPIYLPVGYKIFSYKDIQEGDLFFSVFQRAWKKFGQFDYGKKARYVARKTVNSIFIDM